MTGRWESPAALLAAVVNRLGEHPEYTSAGNLRAGYGSNFSASQGMLNSAGEAM